MKRIAGRDLPAMQMVGLSDDDAAMRDQMTEAHAMNVREDNRVHRTDATLDVKHKTVPPAGSVTPTKSWMSAAAKSSRSPAPKSTIVSNPPATTSE